MGSSVRRRNGDVGYAGLFAQDPTAPHWAYDYAARLAARHPAQHSILIQTSMSPSGPFHIGNLRDTICAHLVHRALGQLGRRSAVLLSFDDYDPVRESQAATHADLAGYAGRPLAVARQRSTAICRAYIAELKRLGICPAEADVDGRTSAGSAWQTHYQWERYTAGTYRRVQKRYLRGAGRLARILGVTDRNKLFGVYCIQCGQNATEIVDLRVRRVRYHCHACGAVTGTADLGPVKPSWALDWTLRVSYERIDCEPAGQDHCSAGSTMDRTRGIYRHFLRSAQPVIVPYGLVRQAGEQRKVSGSRAGGLTATALLRVFAARIILWLYARPNCRSDMRVGLDRSSFLRTYAEFDRFLDRACRRPRDRAIHELLGPLPPPGAGTLPGMRQVLALLHSYCYDPDRVTAVLAHRGADAAGTGERVRHGLAWLSWHGRWTSWLSGAPSPDGDPAVPGVLVDGTLAGRWDLRRHRAMHHALFGVRSAPPLRRLIEVFSAPVLVQAIGTFLDSGERPLQELVAQRLRGAEVSD